eukprot:jgi/Tetstr1/446729/TSEL_034217.t1
MATDSAAGDIVVNSQVPDASDAAEHAGAGASDTASLRQENRELQEELEAAHGLVDELEATVSRQSVALVNLRAEKEALEASRLADTGRGSAAELEAEVLRLHAKATWEESLRTSAEGRLRLHEQTVAQLEQATARVGELEGAMANLEASLAEAQATAAEADNAQPVVAQLALAGSPSGGDTPTEGSSPVGRRAAGSLQTPTASPGSAVAAPAASPGDAYTRQLDRIAAMEAELAAAQQRAATLECKLDEERARAALDTAGYRAAIRDLSVKLHASATCLRFQQQQQQRELAAAQGEAIVRIAPDGSISPGGGLKTAAVAAADEEAPLRSLKEHVAELSRLWEHELWTFVDQELSEVRTDLCEVEFDATARLAELGQELLALRGEMQEARRMLAGGGAAPGLPGVVTRAELRQLGEQLVSERAARLAAERARGIAAAQAREAEAAAEDMQAALRSAEEALDDLKAAGDGGALRHWWKHKEFKDTLEARARDRAAADSASTELGTERTAHAATAEKLVAAQAEIQALQAKLEAAMSQAQGGPRDAQGATESPSPRAAASPRPSPRLDALHGVARAKAEALLAAAQHENELLTADIAAALERIQDRDTQIAVRSVMLEQAWAAQEDGAQTKEAAEGNVGAGAAPPAQAKTTEAPAVGDPQQTSHEG